MDTSEHTYYTVSKGQRTSGSQCFLLIIASITQIQRVDSKERNTSSHMLRLVWVILLVLLIVILI